MVFIKFDNITNDPQDLHKLWYISLKNTGQLLDFFSHFAYTVYNITYYIIWVNKNVKRS